MYIYIYIHIYIHIHIRVWICVYIFNTCIQSYTAVHLSAPQRTRAALTYACVAAYTYTVTHPDTQQVQDRVGTR